MTKYPVLEIFQSIQGEGAQMGLPVTFIRLAGCNLRCPWCDTKQSWNYSDIDLLNAVELTRKVKTKWVVITGGEPTIYDLQELITELKSIDCLVAIETNGTNKIPEDWKLDWVTVSPKPDSNYVINCRADELKYVVDDNFVPDVINATKVPPGRVWLQVESNRPESAHRVIGMVMESPYDCLRVGVQLHKILGVE